VGFRVKAEANIYYANGSIWANGSGITEYSLHCGFVGHDVCELLVVVWWQIRLANGRCVKETFPAEATLANVLEFIQRQLNTDNFQLIQVLSAEVHVHLLSLHHNIIHTFW